MNEWLIVGLGGVNLVALLRLVFSAGQLVRDVREIKDNHLPHLERSLASHEGRLDKIEVSVGVLLDRTKKGA